jgi:hypothetical protein
MAINSKNIARKGMFFSFISIMLLAFFMIIFSNIYSSQIFKAELDVKNAQITSANAMTEFVEDIFIPRMLRASARWATLYLINETNVTNAPMANDIDQLSQRYENLIMNATLEGNLGTWKSFMEEYKMEKWFDLISESIDEDMHLQISFNKSSVDLIVYQISPWYLAFNMSLEFTLKSRDSEWTVANVYSIDFPIFGLQDPLYLMNADRRFANRIFQTNSSAGKDGIWVTQEEFEESLFNHGYYVKDGNSPSFLQRMLNDTEDEFLSKCCGIQSLINPGFNAPPNGLDPGNNKSFVDYMFFNGTTPDMVCLNDPDPNRKLYQVEGISTLANGFKLNFLTLRNFNLTNLYCSGEGAPPNYESECACYSNWPP